MKVVEEAMKQGEWMASNTGKGNEKDYSPQILTK
jgi:hypothetical protein